MASLSFARRRIDDRRFAFAFFVLLLFSARGPGKAHEHERGEDCSGECLCELELQASILQVKFQHDPHAGTINRDAVRDPLRDASGRDRRLPVAHTRAHSILQVESEHDPDTLARSTATPFSTLGLYFSSAIWL